MQIFKCECPEKLIITLTLLFPFFILAQTEINQVYVNSQTTITNCNSIDLGTVVNNNLTFYYTLTNSGQPSGILYIRLKYSGSSNPVNLQQASIQPTNWNNGISQATISCNLAASQIQELGSTIYIEFETVGNIKTKSCEYPFKKTLPPSFSLTPTSLALACGDGNSKVFTVTPSNIPSGASVTYSWNYPGWNGYSSGNSLYVSPLTPYSLPQSVTVTPYVNGISYPLMSCSVTRSVFNSSAVLQGATTVCSSANYTITGLATGETVQWSISNNAIASISNATATSVTVNKIGNGVINLIATVSNACSQNSNVVKSIIIGNPTFPNTEMNGDINPLTNETIWYTVQPPAGYSSLQWYFDYAGTTATAVNGWQILQGQGTESISVKVGNPGLTYVVCKAFNNCGSSIKYAPARVRSLTDPCDYFKIEVKNPIKETENLIGKIAPPIEDPCDLLTSRLSNESECKEIKVFDIYGRLIFSDVFKGSNFDVKTEKISKGTYFLNISLSGGITQKETIIVE